MAGLSANQRNNYYLDEAARTGIHKPILAALYSAHRSPMLTDGEVGLGVSPANRIALGQVNTFPEQVQFAANTVRSATDKLTAQGWKGTDFWNREQGRYTDRFVQVIASGYNPPMNDGFAARLEPTDSDILLQAYLHDLSTDRHRELSQEAIDADEQLPNQTALESALLEFMEQVGRYYIGLSHQREALLEGVRIWRKLNTRSAVIASLLKLDESELTLADPDNRALDKPIMQAIQQLPAAYAGYPHQREALLRLVQFWQRSESREVTIAALLNQVSAETNIQIIDPALMALVQRIPQIYRGKGEQRHALTEGYRFWYGHSSRTPALKDLGVDAQILTSSNPNRNALINTAAQLDRALLEFVKRIPTDYRESDQQREALICLTQLWRRLDSRENAVRSLLDDVQRMEHARRDSPDVPPPPEPALLPPRPSNWIPENIQLHAAIMANGSFTWAEATHGGSQMPSNQAAVDAIVRMAELVQQACDRIGRPLRVIRWYQTAETSLGSHLYHHNRVGDAIDFYCDGLTGDQLYRALDPWWSGGLARYACYPALCHIDARGYRARWTHER